MGKLREELVFVFNYLALSFKTDASSYLFKGHKRVTLCLYCPFGLNVETGSHQKRQLSTYSGP
ncbi:MAG: hypothetical protein ACJAS9_003431 [Polaribacter sp.]|jgi:hypothetical protein